LALRPSVFYFGMKQSWDVAITSEVSAWLTSLPDDAYERVMAVIWRT